MLGLLYDGYTKISLDLDASRFCCPSRELLAPSHHSGSIPAAGYALVLVADTSATVEDCRQHPPPPPPLSLHQDLC